jgi:hypothetical protein
MFYNYVPQVWLHPSSVVSELTAAQLHHRHVIYLEKSKTTRVGLLPRVWALVRETLGSMAWAACFDYRCLSLLAHGLHKTVGSCQGPHCVPCVPCCDTDMPYPAPLLLCAHRCSCGR